MLARKFRWIAYVGTCGMVFQTTGGCEAIFGQLAGTLATTAATSLLNALLLGT